MRGKWRYIICPVVLLLAILASINLWQIFTAYSRIYGSPRFEREEIVNVMYWESVFLPLAELDGRYVFVQSHLPSIHFDGISNDYEILVNGYMSRTQELRAGFIQSVFDITFHDTNGDIASRVVLTILFEFLSTETRLTIATRNTEYELSYLNQFIENHGIRFEVVYRIRTTGGAS